MKVVGIIPVRENSTRLPGKALKLIKGLPAIVHVYKRSEFSKEIALLKKEALLILH